VLDRLAEGDVLAARPAYQHDSRRASVLVRSFYRALNRISDRKPVMMGAGAYGLNEKGHSRVGPFPFLVSDDQYVDTRFDADEKTVVATDPAVVTTPVELKSLLAISRRAHRGSSELLSSEHAHNDRVYSTWWETASSIASTIRGPQSGADAAVYLGIALARRLPYRKTHAWERDESSRLTV
jgi:hypothetical protein